MALFDVDVHFDRTTSSKIEQFIAGIITDNFISSHDALQNITGMTVETTSETTGALNLKDNIHSFYEIITDVYKRQIPFIAPILQQAAMK